MKIKLLLLFSIYAIPVIGSNLRIDNVEFQFPADSTISPRVKMNVSWDNAWHNQRNNDAVWIIVKFKTGDGYRHAAVEKEGHSIVYNPENVSGSFETANNKAGVFLFPDENHRGKIEWTVEVLLDRKSIEKIGLGQTQCLVYGIEMVHIPYGAFTLGDPGTEALDHYSFYRSQGNGAYGGLYKIENENQIIEIGPESEKLYYKSETQEYHGDQKGSIAASFPKGVKAFYCMKYELTQEQYAAFLNSINAYASHFRANFGGKDYYKNRGSIYLDRHTEQYIAESANRPCNYITWDDAVAFADWAGLRPMTEFEFTKACRGPEEPVAGVYPWGTTAKSRLQRGVNLEDNLIMFNGMDESQLNEQTKDLFGASFYWVMDLAGSLWEKVITIGDEIGRGFDGSHGDGVVTWSGDANVNTWPKGMDVGGYGYRGGGYYHHGQNYHGFNPHSPIAYRPYGAWAGGNRSVAYSTRFVHSSSIQ